MRGKEPICVIKKKGIKFEGDKIDSQFKWLTYIVKNSLLVYPESLIPLSMKVEYPPFEDDTYDGVLTEDPWIISAYKKENVFIYDEVNHTFYNPPSETFGASYEVIIKTILNIESTINGFAREKIKEILNSDELVEEKIKKIEGFGDSMEKAYILRKLEWEK